jgi:hypothetical protein
METNATVLPSVMRADRYARIVQGARLIALTMCSRRLKMSFRHDLLVV